MADTDQEFLKTFMSECVEKGHKSTQEICEQALNQIDLLDEEIKKSDLLRAKQIKLRMVIKFLGGNEIKKARKKIPTIDFSVSADQLDSYMYQVCVKICNYIEQKIPTQITVREISEGVGLVAGDFKAVLTAIKWLWDRGIIARNEETLRREISLGPNWEQRPLSK